MTCFPNSPSVSLNMHASFVPWTAETATFIITLSRSQTSRTATKIAHGMRYADSHRKQYAYAVDRSAISRCFQEHSVQVYLSVPCDTLTKKKKKHLATTDKINNSKTHGHKKTRGNIKNHVPSLPRLSLLATLAHPPNVYTRRRTLCNFRIFVFYFQLSLEADVLRNPVRGLKRTKKEKVGPFTRYVRRYLRMP